MVGHSQLAIVLSSAAAEAGERSARQPLQPGARREAGEDVQTVTTGLDVAREVTARLAVD